MIALKRLTAISAERKMTGKNDAYFSALKKPLRTIFGLSYSMRHRNCKKGKPRYG